MLYGKLRKLDNSYLWKIRISIHHAKITMVYVHDQEIKKIVAYSFFTELKKMF